MKKNQKAYSLYFLYAVLLTIYSSCSDGNPIKPKNEPTANIKDTAMYEWQYIPFDGGGSGIVYDLYAADTDKIFIASYIGNFYYNGENFTLIDHNTYDFIVNVVAGSSENNVYLGGGNPDLNPSNHTRLKKWNGSSIQEIQMPDDSSHFINYIYIKSENDIWISTSTNKIYHFDGVDSITTYYLPFEGLGNNMKIWEGINGELYLIGGRELNPGNRINYVLQFKNNAWSVILSDLEVNSEAELRFVNSVAGNDLLRAGRKYVHYFTPDGWQQIPQMLNLEVFGIGGKSKEDFICNALDGYTAAYRMYLYKNNQWYLDTSYFPPYGWIHNQVYILRLVKSYYIGIGIYPAECLIIGRPRLN